MIFGLLLMTLLPLALFPDMLSGPADSDEDDAEPVDTGAGSGDLLLAGDFLSAGDDGHSSESFRLDLLDMDGDTADDDVLAPMIEDDSPDDGSQQPDPQDILAPVIEDDTATPPDGQEGEILAPVDQDDSDAQTFAISSEDLADNAFAEIEDFQIGEDILHISWFQGSAQGPGEPQVLPAENGEDSNVFVGGHLVAVLKGVPDVTGGDVFVDLHPGAG